MSLIQHVIDEFGEFDLNELTLLKRELDAEIKRKTVLQERGV